MTDHIDAVYAKKQNLDDMSDQTGCSLWQKQAKRTT